MHSLAPCRLKAVSSMASRAIPASSLPIPRDFHTFTARRDNTPSKSPSDTPSDSAPAPASEPSNDTPSSSDGAAPAPCEESTPPVNETAESTTDPKPYSSTPDIFPTPSGRTTPLSRRLLHQRGREASRLQKTKRLPIVEAPPPCDLPDTFLDRNVFLHEPFAEPEWPVFDGPNWRSLQASWLQQYYNPHIIDERPAEDPVGETAKEEDSDGAAAPLVEISAEMPNLPEERPIMESQAMMTAEALEATSEVLKAALAQSTDATNSKVETTPKGEDKSKQTTADEVSEPTTESDPTIMPPTPSFDRYRLHFLLAEWKKGELKKALYRDLGAAERRTALLSLSAAYALYAWHVDNNVPVPESLHASIDAVRKAAPSYWGLGQPVAVQEKRVEDFSRGEDVLDNEAVEAMSMPYQQSPSIFIPEMILQKQAFFPDKPNKSNPVSDILEVEKAVYAELHAPPPVGKRAGDVQRPVTVIETAKYGGKRFSKSLVRHIATAVGADLVRMDAQDLSRILGLFLGQDWALSRGPFSLLGFRAAYLNGTLSVPGDLLNYLGYQDNSEQEPAQLAEMLFGAHSEDVAEDAFEDELMKIKEEPMGYHLSSTDRWGNLKIQAALEQLLRAACLKAGGNTEESTPLIIHIDDYVELNMTLEGALIIGRFRYMIDALWLNSRKIVLVGSSSARQRSPDYLRTLKEIATADHLVPFKAEPRLALEYYEWSGSEKVDFLEQNCENLRHVLDQLSPDDSLDPVWLEQQLPFSALAAYRKGLADLREKRRWWSRQAIKEPLKKLFDELRANLGRDYDPIIGSGIVPFTELYILAQRILTHGRSPYADAAEKFSSIYQQLETEASALSETGKKAAFSAKEQNKTASSSSRTSGVNGASKNKGNGSGGTSTQHMHIPKPRPETSRSAPSSSFTKPISRGGRERFNGDGGPFDNMSQLPMSHFTDYEKKLLSGLVDASAIKTTFADVHAPAATIQALKLLTMLSLQRPDAFGYGVLSRDRIPGCLLYGPPGTGKTLLAKAVAKESGANMLEVSGASINEMWVGQGEKNVAAVFSLAKKLAPLVIFIDEADALLASRGRTSGTTSHREVINEFLREWDGMSGTNAFIMVATNRPFDLDEAVLRRLPRKLLIDLPVQSDRQAILGILLKDEQLDPSISLATLAQRTPLYSGSDLKNLCVAAAMAAVREETEAAEQYAATAEPGAEPWRYPVRRTLTKEHFEHALKEIGASISDDMESMKGIRKFDDVHGKPGQQKKRAAMGFGVPGRPKKVDAEDVKVRKEGGE